MQFNYELIKEDVRKIGVALVVAALVTSILKSANLFDIIYPFLGGVILIFTGSKITREESDE